MIILVGHFGDIKQSYPHLAAAGLPQYDPYLGTIPGFSDDDRVKVTIHDNGDYTIALQEKKQ